MKQHISHIAVALAIAALGTACGGRTSAVNMSEERAQGALKANQNQRLALIGCVRPASTTAEGKYILEHATPPPGELDPASPANGPGSLIPRGSWVRLEGKDLKSYLGKEVEISGDLVDAPPNIVGTSGQGRQPQPGDYVRGNGTPHDVPALAVETVKVRNDTCEK